MNANVMGAQASHTFDEVSGGFLWNGKDSLGVAWSPGVDALERLRVLGDQTG